MTIDDFDLGKFIYHKTAQSQQIASAEAINTFFEDLFPVARKKWPFDFHKEGYETTYERLDILADDDNFSSTLVLQLMVTNAHEQFLLKSKITMEFEKVCLILEDVCRIKGWKSTNFGHILHQKMEEFITAQDKARGKNFDASEILLKAVSARDENDTEIRGGYVWANHGFDFASVTDLEYVLTDFKSFTSSHGVVIEEKDLELFTKPCHFAAFNCGLSICSILGRSTYLGKAFLLQCTWSGRLTPTPKNAEKAEEKRYAEAYNSELPIGRRRRLAIETLSSAYRNMVKKYYKKHSRFSKDVITAEPTPSNQQKLKRALQEL